MNRSLHSLSRRDWLRAAAIGIGSAAGSMSGWLGALANDAPRKPLKSVIVLWMNGGPATIDLWDLKPENPNGGPFRPIETAAPGLLIGEHLPKLAPYGKDLAIVRSMSTKEGDHERASFLLRTGYTPVGAIQFPSVGAVLAKELRTESNDLPNFVSVAPTRYAESLSGGFLGPQHDPLVLGDSASPADGLKVADLNRGANVTEISQSSRLSILKDMDRRFAVTRNSAVTASIQSATDRAVRLMRPEAAAAFNLEEETAQTRAAYGNGQFGQGVLLARRLVECGVPFVEVTLDGWDTHQNNFERVRDLCGTLDAAFSSLLSDLKSRGLLESTLVVCQGEFGRTPKINNNTGRDHWPASWAVALAGGGLQTGKTIGSTNEDGTTVADQRVSAPDLIATIAKSVGVDPQKQNMSNVGRPIRVAAPDAKPILELL
ncbi:DUF1501 domain-containing protein [Schlesneria paludicola]|uniref:DUF1501 domain-containing protein n=1 Tax=Schlesneria paludicola TaxID=360056 RepID=UPI00029A22C5|nr:DUF1501 domain-containing protein [Schlesneria paludicola]